MMSAANRDPVAVGKGGQIVRMRRGHHKANDSATFLGRSKHAQSGHFGHSLQGVSRKIDIVLKNLGASDSFNVIDCGGQSDRTGDVRRAGFEAVRWLFKRAFFQSHACDHFAATMPRRN